ncbi:MAG: ABC transporter permease [Clostridia bacterium]|nr:ABC transporter permease [Clostridia bacterium]
MAKYIIKRLLLAVFILFGVSVILYALVRCMPVTIIDSKLAALSTTGALDPEIKAQFYAAYGLEEVTTFKGIITGYFTWLGNILQGDLGTSWTSGMEVSDMIFKNMGVSFGISFVSLILELIIAIPLGIKCACNQYGKLDYVVTVLVMIGISFPSFFLGNLLIKWFGVDLGWFDASGGLYSADLPTDATFWERLGDMLWHLVLPMFVLVVLNVGSTIRYMRTNTLEVLSADYIRTARAKGLSETKVVYKHVFRNTMIPLVTMLAGTLPGLFGGAMITETVFNLPGIGNIAYSALSAGDIPFIMGYNMFIAVLTVIGILLSDLAYALVDPRVKLTK